MPSKFPHHTLDPVDHPAKPGKQITFSFDKEAGHPEAAQKTVEHMQKALADIDTTITMLRYSPAASKKWLEKFFLCDLSKDTTPLIAKYQLIKTGLSGNQRIKIGTIPFKDPRQGAAGAVKQKLVVKNQKDYYTTVGDKTYGAIYFDPESIQQDVGPRLVVHEASHKYAGTSDFFYFESHGTNIVFDATDLYKESKKVDQALFNADSYAWLCYKLAEFGS